MTYELREYHGLWAVHEPGKERPVAVFPEREDAEAFVQEEGEDDD